MDTLKQLVHICLWSLNLITEAPDVSVHPSLFSRLASWISFYPHRLVNCHSNWEITISKSWGEKQSTACNEKLSEESSEGWSMQLETDSGWDFQDTEDTCDTPHRSLSLSSLYQRQQWRNECLSAHWLFIINNTKTTTRSISLQSEYFNGSLLIRLFMML